MALSLFRRHKKACGRTSRRYRRCSCPISVEGTLGGESVRKALDQTSWEAAENEIREWIVAGKIGGARLGTKPIAEAVERYLASARARPVKEGTMKLLVRLLEGQLLPWCERNGYRQLRELTPERAQDFRNTWADAPITALKKLERLRSFFTFCVDSDWIAKNPAKAIKRPIVPDNPTLPFTEEEYANLLAACALFPHNGVHAWDTPKRIRAFLRLLRFTGLRVSDAVRLDASKVVEGAVFLYTQKTGTPVWVPIPPDVFEEIETVRSGRPYYFWSGEGKTKSAISSWDRTVRKLAKKADIPNVHYHRFRDTAAVTWLKHGIPVEDVAILLGHSDPAITWKHYAPWVKERQDRLTQRLRATWEVTLRAAS
jgi:integrase/recombinase XerD